MDYWQTLDGAARGLIFALIVLAFYALRWAFRALMRVGRRAAAIRPEDVARSAGRVAGKVERRATSTAEAFKAGRRS